jgi:2-iminobutanoate/2-iminopropanoate deaminase
MKKIIETATAPLAIGPYSQAVVHNGIVYASGQIPLDPETNNLVEDDITIQTTRVLENLKAVLTAAGSSLDRVLRTTVYLRDMDEFPLMNDVYGKYFTSDWPARATVQAAKLPKNVRVEIDCIASVA